MRRLSACRKSMFFQQKCLSSIPIRTLCGLCVSAIVVVCCRCVLHRPCSTTCMHPCIKPLGVLSRHPCRNPKPLSRKGGEYGDWRPCDLPWGYAPNPIFNNDRGFSTACQPSHLRRLFFILRMIFYTFAGKISIQKRNFLSEEY